MLETDLIHEIQSHLDSKLSVPIRVNAVDDERPVPVIFIEDWDTVDKNIHNDPFAGEATGDFDNDDKKEYERYLRFDFRTRVTFSIRHRDEVKASQLQDSLKNEIRLIAANPLQFHNSVKEVTLAGSGNPTNNFTEPKESELMLAARFNADHIMTRTDYDQIESIKRTFSTN